MSRTTATKRFVKAHISILCGLVAFASQAGARADEAPSRATSCDRVEGNQFSVVETLGQPCSATLTVANPRVALGEKIDFSITISNISDKKVTVLNPTFSSLVRMVTVDLLILDRHDNPVGELYKVGRRDGSSQRDASWFWQSLAPGATVKKNDSVRASVMKLGKEQLRPGKYRLQIVFFDRFLSEDPFAGLPAPIRRMPGDERVREAKRQWNKKYSGEVVFRSNIVEIEVF